MTRANPISDLPESVRRALHWTRLGMELERVVRAVWPLASVFLACVGIWILGGASLVPSNWHVWIITGFCVVILMWLILKARRIRSPLESEVVARLDETLPHRPISALLDEQATGAEDPATRAIWEAHIARLKGRLENTEARKPDLRVSAQDPYALRLVALLIFAVAVLFGGTAQNGSDPLNPRLSGTVVAGPAWEGWIEPPYYTGLPGLYLNDLIGEPLDIPQGSKITVRLYGDEGALSLNQSVDDGAVFEAGAPELSFEARADGLIEIRGQGGEKWNVHVSSDSPPEVDFDGELDFSISGDMMQPFAATDDYGVDHGQATIILNEALLDRRYGLTPTPEPVDPIILDLPVPFSGDRREFSETLTDNMTKHPWVGLPVSVTLEVTDGAGQIGQSSTLTIALPGRRFYDPAARAIVELRRDLLWSRENAPRVAMLLRTITHLPETVFDRASPYLMLRTMIYDLENKSQDTLTETERDELAEALWIIALQLEEGDAWSALERMRQAQERLNQAMRDGASDSEIQELMDELRDATRDYMRELAQNPESSTDQPNSGETQMLSQQDIQDMLDRIEELMQQGRFAEAEELMRQFQQMMENLRMTDQTSGEGEGSTSDQAMDGMGETLRDQQELSDQTFQNLQDMFDGESGDNPSQEELAEQQRALREEIERQRENLPQTGTEEGDAAEEALRDAERAMDEAEEDLRDGNLPGALDNQADAMEALREGMRQLAEDQRRTTRDMQGNTGSEDPNSEQDPLGRNAGGEGSNMTEDGALTEDAHRRALELLNELRDRSSDPERTKRELDYLLRLLDRF